MTNATPPPASSPPTSPLGELPAEIWRTRPHRPAGGGLLGGVSAGVGRRYGVDPVLVRVAFVVATIFGGGGVPAYLACWLLLPREGDPASAGEAFLGRGRSSMSRGQTIVLLVIGAVASLTAFGGGGLFLGGGVIGALLLVTGLALLHRRRPTPPVMVPPAPPHRPSGPTPVDLAKDGPGAAAGADVPPSWDPLGAASFAWDLPEPMAPTAPRPPRSRHTPMTLGIALLVVGAAIAVRLITDWSWLNPPHVAALALAVVGAGLVVGAPRRRGWGLLPVTAPLVGFVVLSSLAGSSGFHPPRGFGDQDWSATTATELQDHYSSGVGNATLDLRRLTLTGDRTVQVDSTTGDIDVALPTGLDVILQCSAGVGDVDCPWTGLDPGDDGPGGPVLTLAVQSGVGDIEVQRD